VLRNGNTEGPGLGRLLAHRKSIAMKFKVGTTAYQRKTKTQRDVIVTIFIDETVWRRAINNRSKESKVLRGIIRRWGSHLVRQVTTTSVRSGERWDLSGC
jgi:hypothetical protein